VEVKLTVNEFYIQSVIDDRKKEVSKIVEDNQIYSHLRGSAANQRESAEQGKNVLSMGLLKVAKRLKGVFAIKNKGSVKV
jgi:hypothetical protein